MSGKCPVESEWMPLRYVNVATSVNQVRLMGFRDASHTSSRRRTYGPCEGYIGLRMEAETRGIVTET